MDDSSTQGTQIKDDGTLPNHSTKTVRGRRQAAPGLCAIIIGPYIFEIRAPISIIEVRRRENWFRVNKPVLVTNALLHRQLGGLTYEWLRMDRVGRGGGGEVYRYMEKNTALFIAIKEERTNSKEHKARVMKEINFMKTLRHVSCSHALMAVANSVKPFLVDFLFDFSDNKLPPTVFTVMPLYLGHLRSILPLPNMPTTERIMIQIAEGLHFMHSSLVLHRDLKPENVLIVSPENIKIADYGWATSLKDTDSLYGVCGTFSYCAPEAFKPNGIHTTAMDVYSLGAIFYSMLDLDKVERGWVSRFFNGRREWFNTTFESASQSPPHHFPGLVQSMLAPNPKGRCSLDECIGVVKAQKHDWIKQTHLMPVATATHLAAGRFGIHRTTANATRLQQTPFRQARAKANTPKLTPYAQAKKPETHQSPQQAPVNHHYKNWQPIVQRQEAAAPTPQAVPKQKLCEPARVQGVNFNAGLPSYEEATSKNPFARLADSREIAKKRHRSKLNQLQNIVGPVAEQRAKPEPTQSKKSKKKHLSFNGVSPMIYTKTAAQLRVSATHSGRSASYSTSITRTRDHQSRNSRQIIRRPREHAQALDIRRTGTGRIRKTTLTGIKAGAIDMGKGLYQLGRGLGTVTCNMGCLTAQGILMLYDMATTKQPPPNAGLVLNTDGRQLMVTMNAHPHRRVAERQRPGNVYTNDKVVDVQRMASNRRSGLQKIGEGVEPGRK